MNYQRNPNETAMLAGQKYDATDPHLVRLRQRAHALCRQYNARDEEPDSPSQRSTIKDLLGQMGDGCFIEAPFRCDYGKNIILGKNVYMNFNATILDCNMVTIGDNVKFGPNVSVYTATHPVDPTLRSEGPEMAYPITIGKNVWVGGSAVILPGVTIGEGSTIGAGSVVTKDVEPYVVVVGNPARVVKRLERQ